MREAKSAGALLFEYVEPKGKTVVEIGCGTGELARELTARGARVIAIDREAMLAAAAAAPRAGTERYVAASGEALPVRDCAVDLVLYVASLHHLPPGRLDDAIAECRRVMRPEGRAVFIEPVYRRGSYTDLTRLVEDEREVQRVAYQAIRRASTAGLDVLVEEPFFIARSFADYEQLIATFVEEPAKRPGILQRARAITVRRAAAKALPVEAYRYRSICRLNILRAAPRTGAGERVGASINR